jgi:hypothetical protein
MMMKLAHPGRKAVRVGVLTLAVAAMAGCQSIDMNTAQLRVIDASPDAGALDSYQNGTGLAYNLQFGAMTSYVPMTPGSYSLTATRAGTRQVMVAASASLVANRQYTEIVGNIAANMQNTVLQDQTTPAPAGQMAVRLVQEATRAGAVDVYMVPKSGRPVPLATNLGFGANSGYLTLPAGTYALAVVPAGTVLVSSTVTLLSGAEVEYASGAVRTVVLIDPEILGTHAAGLTAGVHAIVAEDAG